MARQRAIYQRIADELRADITAGTLREDMRLPTEAELAQRWKTSRATAVQGLKVLVNEGLIVADRPRGYFVRKRRPMVYRPQAEFRIPEPDADIFRQRIADEQDSREPSQKIEVAISSPSKTVQRRLHIDAKTAVAVRRRMRSIDGDPFNLNDSHVPLSLVEGTDWMSPEDVPRGTNRVLAELGYEIIHSVDEIMVRMPTPEESSRLALGPGTPVAEHIVTGYARRDGRETPVQVTVNILPGDRHVIIYDRVREGESA
ncbi:UTRA domain-containing protein [Streptomyces alkaliphilus]|uniref:UTRA domain-containing protein n=1 Tax=Streptomyces alkaliphilus TaxID=1472722 RepID=A0A7W3TDV8_9ACTN|nr:GntR family transcriptional regulator [Streptomyces alkaliphilus]MBB0245054.1 UTRA domain-containing protein [Streptomyces alkaliphilus]